MARDVTRDELAAALASGNIIVEHARWLRGEDRGDVFTGSVRYPGAVAEELLAHIEAGRAAEP